VLNFQQGFKNVATYKASCAGDENFCDAGLPLLVLLVGLSGQVLERLIMCYLWRINKVFL